MNSNSRLPITIPEAEREQLKQISDETGAPMSVIVLKALREYLDRHTKTKKEKK